MTDLIALLSQLEIPPDQLARIAEQIKRDPLAAIAVLNEYVPPEIMQQMVAALLGNPDAVEQMAEQAGISAEQLTELRQQFGAGGDV